MSRTLQLVLHYDGAGFAGWQRQSSARTVQGELEAALARLCGEHIPVTGAGRTDAGVHARGQAAGVRVPDRWNGTALRRSLNAVLPKDVWVAAVHDMRETFHARYDATGRRYTYHVGISDAAQSPFRRAWELAIVRPLDVAAMRAAAACVIGDHAFHGFAVKGTAPADDPHRCIVRHAEWTHEDGRLVFTIEANRFLHHMVRFLVGTMLDIGSARRPLDDMPRLLVALDNRDVSAPAPAHALFLDAVTYPRELYVHAEAFDDTTGALRGDG